jgi:hypothetical protein
VELLRFFSGEQSFRSALIECLAARPFIHRPRFPFHLPKRFKPSAFQDGRSGCRFAKTLSAFIKKAPILII